MDNQRDDNRYGQNRYLRNRKPDNDRDQWGGFFRKGESRNPDDQNIDKGSELRNTYHRGEYDRYGHRRSEPQYRNRDDRHDSREGTKDWDEGNFFHTGPSPRGSRQYEEDQRHHTTNQKEEYFSNHYRNQDRQLRSMNDQHGHYGARPDSVYRRKDNLNYGDHREDQLRGQKQASPGSGYEPNRRPVGLDHNPHTEGPLTGSRYKEDDYRYGSGNHNFYREGRYQRGGGIGQGFEDNKGFFERVGDGIRDAWESVTNDDRDNVEGGNRRYPRDGGDQRRDYSRGYESGPKWADESDTGRDRSKPYPTGYRKSQDPERNSWTDYDADRERGW
jgi:hypothetical protein